MRPDTTADWYLYVAIVRILLIAFLNLLPSESSQINYVEFMSFIVPRQGNRLNPHIHLAHCTMTMFPILRPTHMLLFDSLNALHLFILTLLGRPFSVLSLKKHLPSFSIVHCCFHLTDSETRV